MKQHELVEVTIKWVPAGAPVRLFDLYDCHMQFVGSKKGFVPVDVSAVWDKLQEVDMYGETREQYRQAHAGVTLAWEGGHVLAPEPWIGMRFVFVGESIGDGPRGWADYSQQEVGLANTFMPPELDALEREGRVKLAEMVAARKAQGTWNPAVNYNAVTFVSVWQMDAKPEVELSLVGVLGLDHLPIKPLREVIHAD